MVVEVEAGVESEEILNKERIAIVKQMIVDNARKAEEYQRQLKGVYLIGNTDLRWYKIGIADDMDRRIASVQLGVPFAITFASKFPTANPRVVEYEAHHTFKLHRLRGEWFAFDIRQLSQVTKFLQDMVADKATESFPTIGAFQKMFKELEGRTL